MLRAGPATFLYLGKRPTKIERIRIGGAGSPTQEHDIINATMQCGCCLRIIEIAVGSLWPEATENEVGRDFLVAGQLTGCIAHKQQSSTRDR